MFHSPVSTPHFVLQSRPSEYLFPQPYFNNSQPLQSDFAFVTDSDTAQSDFDARLLDQFIDLDAATTDTMDFASSLVSEGVIDPQTLPESYDLQNHVTQKEVLGAFDQPLNQAEDTTSLTNGAADVIAQTSQYQEASTGILVSEAISTPTLGADHTQSIAAIPHDQDYIAFDHDGNTNSHTEENHYPSAVMDEQDISGLAIDPVPETEAGKDANPSEEHSVTAPNAQPEQALETPVVEATHTVTEPLRRMDDETIPVTAHHKDSIIEILDNAPLAAAEMVQLNGIGNQPIQDETVSFEEPQKAPEDDSAPMDTSAEPSQSKTIYLEHIQVIEPDDPIEEDENMAANAEVPVQVQNGSATERVQSTLETDTMLAPSAMEVEPVSAVSTEFAIENDPALALTETATTTTEEAPVPADDIADATVLSNLEAQSEPEPLPETDVIASTTTTAAITIVVETETEPEPEPEPEATEQPDLGARADADADDDQTEYMRRAEQTRLEQSNMDVAEQSAQDKDLGQAEEQLPVEDANTASERVGESVLDQGAPTLDEQLKQGQEIAAGPIDPVVLANPASNPPDGDLSPRAPQYAIAPDTSSATVAPAGLFDQPKSPEWQGFAALDADAPGSPEFADHSSEIIEGPQNDSEVKDDDTEPALSTDIPRNRKPKMIMEVVIPISGKDKKATKTESPEPKTRGRSKSRAAGSSKPSSSRKPKPRSRSSGSQRPSSATPTATRTRKRYRPFGSRKKKPGKLAPVEHVVNSKKVEVVMQKKPGLLRRMGSIASGNNVKFAPAVETSKKRKAESEPAEESRDSDVDAEGEIEEGYEDVEEDEEPKPVSKPGPSKPGPSKPIKRPRRSISARKMPTKVPEVLIDTRVPKKRRLRR